MNEIVSTSADAAVRYLLIGSIAAAILVPLAWLTLRATRLRAPVYRHMVWLYCLIGTVALPAIWLHGPKLMLPVLPARVHVSEAPPCRKLRHSPRSKRGPAVATASAGDGCRACDAGAVRLHRSRVHRPIFRSRGRA